MTHAPRPKPRFLTLISSLRFRLGLAGAALVLGLLAWISAEYRSAEPFVSSYPYRNLRSVAVGPDGRILASDSGERRILGLGADGMLAFVLRGERRSGGFYNGRPIGFDSLGRFYVDDTVMDLETSNTARRQVLRFDARGRYLGEAMRFDYEGEAMEDWESHAFYTQILDDRLYWFMKAADGSWKLHAVPLVGEASAVAASTAAVSAAAVIDLEFNPYDTVDIAVLSTEELYVLGYDGSVARWTAEGGLEDWFLGGDAGRIRFPTAIGVDTGRKLLVTDGKRTVYGLDPGKALPALRELISPASLARAGFTRPVAFQDVRPLPAGGFALGNEFSGELLLVAADGSVRGGPAAPLGAAMRALNLLSWAALAGAAACLAALVAASYLGLLVGRTHLVVKQLLVFIPIIVLMVLAVGAFIYRGMSSTLETQIRDRLLHLAHLGATRAPAEAVDALDFGKASLEELLASEARTRVAGVLDELVNVNQDPWDSQIFPYVYKKDAGAWWIVGSFDYTELYPYMRPEFDAVVETGEPVWFRYDDAYGSWLSACAPVKREDGGVAAIFEASMSADVIDEAKRGYLLQAALGGTAILALFLGAFSAFTALLLRSVRQLRAGAARVARGDFGTDIDIRSRDEIAELGDAFNAMSREIRGHVDSLAKLSRANERFVPREFINRLGREDITEVGLGDQVLTEMAVLFSDIRNFTGLAEDLGPAGTMDFLNDYLSRVGPAVRATGGFIDKYVGDSIMALFPGGADDALDAALAVSSAVDGFRADLETLGARDMAAGIGVHIGPLMLGIIGEEERFDGTVIADAVNLASRIESLTKFYGVRILTSGETKDRSKRRRRLRFIDVVRVKGKQKAVRLYELLRPEDPELSRKLASVGHYVKGFEAYRAGRFTEAATGFQAALSACPGDHPAEMLLAKCAAFAASGAPAGWKGITEFHEK